MLTLGLDFGSSSVKAALLRNGRVVGKIVHGQYPTSFDGIRAEIDSLLVLQALRNAVTQLGKSATRVDCIAIDAMAPSWVAMDAKGAALTPIITHQDRRSMAIACEIEKRVGKARHLKLCGNRPVPGGISSTTWAWYRQNAPALLKKADLVGHLTTFLHRNLTGARVTDPSNASFMGVYSTLSMKGWNEELCNAIGAERRLLPELMESNVIAGQVTPAAAARYGLKAGTPVLTGIMDTSSALLVRGANAGQMLNICGTTDVLAICTEHPKPHELLLTRAVGVGKKWMQVSTIAAAGSALTWAHRQFFAELPDKKFFQLVQRLADSSRTSEEKSPVQSSLQFDPYLAGDRTSLERKTAAFTGITLATTREQLLGAIINSLSTASANRLSLFKSTGTKIKRDVLLSGGLSKSLARVLHRSWPGKWTFSSVDEATLMGLARMAQDSGNK